MAGDEFNFGKTERREPRRFEPPPWEIEEGAIQAEVATSESPVTAAADEELEADTAEESAEEASEAGGQPEAEDLEAMIAELKTTEEADSERVYRISLVMAAIVTVIGLATAISGMVAAFRMGSSPSAAVLALVVLGTGLGFSAIGLRLMYKTLRQRGAL